jgi:hypothetical protein
MIMIYKVVISENTVVVVTADNFEVNDGHKRVFFIKDKQRVACFNLNNVLGFYKFQEDDEEPENYIERFCR